MVKRQAFSSCLTSPRGKQSEHQKKPRKRIALSNPFRHLLLGCIASLLSWPQRKLWPLALVRGAKPPFNPLIGCADLGPALTPQEGHPLDPEAKKKSIWLKLRATDEERGRWQGMLRIRASRFPS